MVSPIPRYESGDTRMFTVTYSVAPSTPHFTIYEGSGGGTIVESKTATASSTTAFFAYHTMSGNTGFRTYEWVASYTAGPVVDRGLFRIVKTEAG